MRKVKAHKQCRIVPYATLELKTVKSMYTTAFLGIVMLRSGLSLSPKIAFKSLLESYEWTVYLSVLTRLPQSN